MCSTRLPPRASSCSRRRSARRAHCISLHRGTHFARRLRRVLEALEPGSTELMVHPGHVDASLAAQDPYTAPREIELAALLSAGVRDRLRRGDIELVSFAAL